MMKRLFLAFVLLPLVAVAAEMAPIGWGVVTAVKTTVYDKTGKPAGALAGGDLFGVLREVKMNKAPAYYIEIPGTKKAVTGIVSAADTRYFVGTKPDLTDADAFAAWVADRKFCQEYYALCAMRDGLVERKREQHRAKSPAKRLETAKKELSEALADAKRYKAEYEKAKNNSRRLKAQDLYKEARFTATGLNEEIKSLEAEVVTWDEKHPFDESVVKKTAVWKRLDAQVKAQEARFIEFNEKYPITTPATTN
jgi:hypothetical protein